MDRIDHILVYVQAGLPGDDALSRASRLARASKARVELLTVFGHESSRSRRGSGSIDAAGMRRGRRVLEACADALSADGVRVTVQVRHGRPSDEIVDHAVRGGHDLVIKTGNPTPGLSRWKSMGTTAVRLLRRCPSPVWITRDGVRATGPVLAAIDAYDDPERRRLNDRVMSFCEALCLLGGHELHVVHVWNVLGVGMLTGRVSRDELRDYIATTRDAARRAVHRYLESHRAGAAPPARVHLARGDASEQIPAIAERIGASVVVMGNCARAGLSGYLIGNTAEQVLPKSVASIVAVRPVPHSQAATARWQRRAAPTARSGGGGAR